MNNVVLFKYPQSPYDTWWNVSDLMDEAKRLLQQPRPEFNAKIIMRWRRKQVWLINNKIAFIAKQKKEKVNV